MKKIILAIKPSLKVILASILVSVLVFGKFGTINTYAYYANHVISGLYGMAAPMEGTESTEGCAYAGDGTYVNPYKIAVDGNINGYVPNTRPSAFWGIWAGGPGGTTSITHFKVVFENRGSTLDGKLRSSFTYDMIDHDSLGDGLSTQYVKDPANIWDGSWTYAFRLAPWTAFDTSTGDLHLAFAWKGQFSFYYNNWEFKFDAVGETAGLSEDKQLHPGDRVALTYYGGYDTNQTSRGTNYTVNFATTDANAVSTVVAKIDNDGYATFSGNNMISYGGNYVVTKAASVPVESIQISEENDETSIEEEDGFLQLSATLSPLDNDQQNYTWSIASGDSLATIDQNGFLKAKGTGNGTIVVRATSTQNPAVYGEYTVAILNNLPSYDIIFNPNGGSNLSKSNFSLLEGSKIGTLPTCNRTGYTFDGWYTSATAGSIISSSTLCTKNETYYAHWTAVSVDKVKITSLKSGNKQFFVKYNAIVGSKGYEIRYSLNSNMSSAKTVKTNDTEKLITGLKAGKKYYVQVRTCKLDSTNIKVYGAWSAKKTVTIIKISVSKTDITSLTAGKKKFTVKYNKVSGAKGYEIRYSVKSSMGNSKVVSSKGTEKTVTGLKKGKKYYVQVRAYKMDSTGGKVYAGWSAKETVKVK